MARTTVATVVKLQNYLNQSFVIRTQDLGPDRYRMNNNSRPNVLTSYEYELSDVLRVTGIQHFAVKLLELLILHDKSSCRNYKLETCYLILPTAY